jgi:hypothetical protein
MGPSTQHNKHVDKEHRRMRSLRIAHNLLDSIVLLRKEKPYKVHVVKPTAITAFADVGSFLHSVCWLYRHRKGLTTSRTLAFTLQD